MWALSCEKKKVSENVYRILGSIRENEKINTTLANISYNLYVKKYQTRHGRDLRRDSSRFWQI